ncbi:ferrochelatase [SAR86 cluster bacterium]|nr:ferrochelatase [SAR86 cluster bacterium]
MKYKKALLIINLGTPDDPSYFSVFKFLKEFLSDPRVIDIPRMFRILLVNLIICPLRSFSSSKVYRQMWKANNNESPIKTNTEKLIQKLQNKLPKYDVYSAMRYQNPSIKDTLSEILLTNPDEIIIFPSFPQYASSTTGSVYEEVFNILSKEWVIPKIKFINQFFNNDLFINAWIEKISDFDLSNYEKIIFSYHGLPDTQVDKVYNEGKCIDQNCDKEFNDINKFCYKASCYETTRLITSKLNLNEDQYVTAFQSRLTKKWLTPFTDEVIENYAKNNVKNILVIAPAFTTDNLETLIEIGDEYVELFNENGGDKLDFVSSLNDSDKWVDAIIAIMEK